MCSVKETFEYTFDDVRSMHDVGLICMFIVVFA